MRRTTRSAALLGLAPLLAATACEERTPPVAAPCVSVTPSIPGAPGVPNVPGVSTPAVPPVTVPGSPPNLPTTAPPSLPTKSAVPGVPGVPGGPTVTISTKPIAQATQLCVTTPPVQPPIALEGRFQLVVTGFRATHETVDHLIQDDGKRDEIQIRAKVRTVDLTTRTGEFSSVDSRVMGDVNNQSGRVQAGSASDQGGIRTGDDVTGCCELPFPLWRGTLRAGRDAVAVVPMLWEIDKVPDGELTEPDWRTRLGVLAPDLLLGAANGVRSRLSLPALPATISAPLPGSATIDAGQLIRAVDDAEFKVRRRVPGPFIGRAGDRPVGFRAAVGAPDFQDYFPQVVALTYETAQLATQTGGGAFTISLREDQHWLEGDYTLHLRIERI